MVLRYNPTGKFRIMQFTDLHLGAFPFNENDKKTLLGIEKEVKTYHPDLLVFSGDIIYSMIEHGATNPEKSFSEFITFTDSLNIPYTVTFGNHDAEEQITRSELRDIFEKQAKNAVIKNHSAIIADRENFTIELLGSNSDEVKNVFYILDSGDYSNTEHSYYAWVLPEQISWFKATASYYKRPEPEKKDLIFQHIPIPEYWLASQSIIDGNFHESIDMILNGINSMNEFGTSKISFDNGVYSPEINSGFFSELVMNGHIWGMFVGHDHDNSFNGLYKGIHLVYGQSTGYNTYGTEPKGTRVIDLFEEKAPIETFSTYF